MEVDARAHWRHVLRLTRNVRPNSPLWELSFGVPSCAPHNTPLWVLLPRDVQEHIGRFLAQKLLWVLLNLYMYSSRGFRDRDDKFEQIVDNMRRACPVFHRALRTVFQLSVPARRWTHHEVFARGLVRLAWDLGDRQQIAAQGAAHVSKCWTHKHGGVHEVRKPVQRYLAIVAKGAYESSRVPVLPEHYLRVIEQHVLAMVLEEGALRWVHGRERREIENVVLCVLNAPWSGRTDRSQMHNRKALRRVMDKALERPRANLPNL